MFSFNELGPPGPITFNKGERDYAYHMMNIAGVISMPC